MRGFLLRLLRRRRLHQEIESELAFHREMSAENGNPIPLGNTSLIKDQAFDLWRFNFLENLWRDFRYAVRGLSRSPALVFSALLSLALAIGGNAGVFSLGVEFLFSEPSLSDPASVVAVHLGRNSHAGPEVLDAVREGGVFQDAVGENEETYINWNDGTETRRIFSVVTTKNFFSTLGGPMEHGRGYLPSDPDEVVVLRHDFWRKHFNGDTSIVGRAINLEGKAYTVVGVLPPTHRTLLGFGFSPDVYLPRYQADTIMAMYARLKPGMSIEQARAGLELVAARLAASAPKDSPHPYSRGFHVTPVAGFARFQDEPQLRTVGIFFAMLLVVVGLVLLIACVNVASLLLARASARRRESAIRLSLGASRGRLMQQMLVESLLLSLGGAFLGVVLGHTAAKLLAVIQLPLPIPIRLRIDPDWRVALYAALLAIGATLAAGLLPAWQSVRESIAANLHRERRLRLRKILVAAQIGISLIVLTTGALFVRNLIASRGISPGFDVRNTLRAEVHLPTLAYKDQQKKALFIDAALREIEAIPGIEAAAAARIIPFTGSTRFAIDLTLADTGAQIQARFNWNAVTAGYFTAMDIPLVRGRAFSAADRGGVKVAIVNRTFVERYLADRSAVGVTFLWGAQGKTAYEIVGVVEDTKNMSLGEDPMPQLYEPLAQIDNQRTKIQFVARSGPPPVSQIDAVRQALRRVDPAAGAEVATLYSSIGLAFLPSQVGAVLLGTIGVLGLLLASVGLYGVMAYSVERRTREIGVRIAVGAGRSAISRMVLIDSVKLIAAGIAGGLAIAIFVTKPLAMFLVPGLKPTDAISFSATVIVLIATGLAATWGPVRRALRVDPMSSLRHE